LEAVSQHRSVDHVEDVVTDVDDEIVANADDVAIEGGVMGRAQRHAAPGTRRSEDTASRAAADVMRLLRPA
jgi:hypothetical protein